jgi:uncharacterized protein YlxP (DUF503 family)
MTYETYDWLRYKLDLDIAKAQDEYLIAVSHVGYGDTEKTVRQVIWQTYSDRTKKFEEMKKQLRYAAYMSHGPKMSKAMKRFWGLEEYKTKK